MSANRCLRLGIILGGRLVEERVIPAWREVTIGREPRNDLIVPVEAVPPRWQLFERRRGRLVLRLAPTMAARVAAGTELRALSGGHVCPVADRARGRITAGDATILFQLVSLPPPRPRVQLPASVRGGLGRELDRLFSGIVLASAFLHLAMVLYLRQVDWPRRPSIEEVPARFVRQILRRLPPKPVLSTPPEVKPAEKTPTVARPTRPESPRPRPAPTAEDRRAALQERVRRSGLVLVIGAAAERAGSVADLLSSGGVDRSQEEVLRDVAGVKVAEEGGLHGISAMKGAEG